MATPQGNQSLHYDAQPLCHARRILLPAIRNSSASRSLIAFTAWSSLVHAALIGTQALQEIVARPKEILFQTDDTPEATMVLTSHRSPVAPSA
jgi:hypothetical protein